MEKNLNCNNNVQENILFKSNPKDIIIFRDLTKDSYSFFIENTFTVFKSINDILYLIYTNENKSLISFNIIENNLINEIKNAHNEYITNIRYYYNKTNKRDLILSISCNDNNIKIWNINNLECLLNLTNIYKTGYLYSACFLNDNNNIYIITSNCNKYGQKCESIKVYDLYGKKIKEINESNSYTHFIDTYYDNQLSTVFIMTGNKGFIKAHDYNKNKIYHKYYDNYNKNHYSITINNSNEIVKIIDSCMDGFIRIWNFHTGKLINKIQISNNELHGICLWNNEFILVGSESNSIKIIDLNNYRVIKELKSNNSSILSIKKILHPQYGECLISQGKYNGQIQLWINKI